MKGEDKPPRRTRGEQNLLLKRQDATERRLEHCCRKNGTFPPPYLWARAATKGAQCCLPKSAKCMDVRREYICTLIMTAREF